MNSRQVINLFPLNKILIKNKIYNIKHNNEEYKSAKINLLETQNLYSLDNSNNLYNEENDRKYSGYSSENSDDINYNPSPALKDKILSPGDGDICIQKSNFIKPERIISMKMIFAFIILKIYIQILNLKIKKKSY